MVGNEINPAKEPVPPGVVTLIEPEPPEGVTAVIVVGEIVLNELAGTPAKLTAVTPLKLVPVMVTVTPAAAVVGTKPVIPGGGRKVKPPREPWPVGVTTFTFPEAPLPTVALMEVDDNTVNPNAETPPKLTDVAPKKFTPVIMTRLPAPAIVGVKEVTITGG